MLRKLRTLSGTQVVRILEGFGFAVVSQRGSHVKLRRTTADGLRQTLTLPIHRELDTGTLRAIVRQVSQYVPTDQLESLLHAIAPWQSHRSTLKQADRRWSFR